MVANTVRYCTFGEHLRNEPSLRLRRRPPRLRRTWDRIGITPRSEVRRLHQTSLRIIGVVCRKEHTLWNQRRNVVHRDAESKTLGFAEEAAMFGYGLIGTLVVIILVIWIIRAL
jgi:hypothetical protein